MFNDWMYAAVLGVGVVTLFTIANTLREILAALSRLSSLVGELRTGQQDAFSELENATSALEQCKTDLSELNDTAGRFVRSQTNPYR